MPWESLDTIDSVEMRDMHEYMSRPTPAVKEFISGSKDDIVIWGPTGKWMSDLSEMVLRAVREGGNGRKVHLVGRFSRPEEFDARFGEYQDHFEAHKFDVLDFEKGFGDIPSEGLVIYGVGYKFRDDSVVPEEYRRLCSLYGNAIPEAIFSHHKNGANVVVIGSGNGLPLTAIGSEPDESVDLAPDQPYGMSIRDKETVAHRVIGAGSSTGVILRGMYFGDFSYGAIEQVVRKVHGEKDIDKSSGFAFNFLSHRDANRYSILAAQLSENSPRVVNLSGPTLTVEDVGNEVASQLGLHTKYVGEKGGVYLLANGNLLMNRFGQPIDSTQDIVKAQTHWVANNGYSRDIDHKVGKTKLG